MKLGLATSVVVHSALLAFGLLTLSAPAPLEVTDSESFPVDIVPIEELSQMQQGDKTATVKETAAPKPTKRPDIVADAQSVGDNSVDTKEPPTPEPTDKSVTSTAVPPPSPKPVDKPLPKPEEKPEVKPEPAPATEVAPVSKPKEEVKPEPVKQPEPKPVKETPPVEKPPEVKPDAVAEAIEAEPTPAKEAKPETPKPEAVAEATDEVQLPTSAPSPEAKPKPPQAQTAKTTERKETQKPAQEASANPQSTEKEFNAADIKAILDKQKPSGGGAKRSTKEASLGADKTTGGTKLSQTEMDALRGQVQKCWNIPAGAMDGDKLRVSVKFKLSPDGELDGSPEIISGGGATGVERAAAESARRAVSRCAPYNLPADKYDAWADVIVNFDPSDMF